MSDVEVQPLKSEENRRKLESLLSRGNYSYFRFLVAPDKKVSDEALMGDVCCFLSALEAYRESSDKHILYSAKTK
ncbi:MAG: hypothetical protein LBS25_06365 [Candidatus Symbiothrix sp.]|jgi:hypothetical protein|nr:hypothetical protein [Candidatus Symbiothrix sp.]